jgi:hypothetical protein
MNQNILLQLGYKSYKPYKDGTSNLFQKSFSNSKGIKYFINIHEYNCTYYNNYVGDQSYLAEALLYRGNTEFSILVHIHDESIQQIEQLIELVWNNMDCKLDIYNN